MAETLPSKCPVCGKDVADGLNECPSCGVIVPEVSCAKLKPVRHVRFARFCLGTGMVASVLGAVWSLLGGSMQMIQYYRFLEGMSMMVLGFFLSMAMFFVFSKVYQLYDFDPSGAGKQK